MIVGLGGVNKKIPGALIAVVVAIACELRRSTCAADGVTVLGHGPGRPAGARPADRAS